MSEQRTFYKQAMKSGDKQLQVYLPKNIVEGLEIEDRDELEITLKKTGHKIKKRERPFGKPNEVKSTF